MNRQTHRATQHLFFLSFLCAINLILLFSPNAKSAQAVGSGAISLTSLGAVATENFDTLASSGASSALPNGWYFDETGTGANITYTAGTGSIATGDTYSFGISSTNPITDRAFGTLRSGSVIPTIGAQFANNTGAVITSLVITYTGEMWRAGVANRNAADRLDFQLSADATSLSTGAWTDYNNLDFASPVISTTSGAKDGNNASFRTTISYTISGLNIANGSSFWIRWTDFDISNADDGLAVDDFFLSPFGVIDIPPSISSTIPISNATDVALDSNIVIAFSEPVSVFGSWFAIACGNSGSHAAFVSGGPTTYTLVPSVYFAISESCTVTLFASQVADQDGAPNNMASDYVWSFSTSATDLAPRVSNTTPISNAINVAVNSNIAISFTEAVTFTSSSFTISCTGGTHPAAVSGGPIAFTLDPTADFAPNESCMVTVIANQVTDQDAVDPPDQMDSNYQWAFTTAPPLFRIHDIQGIGHLSIYSGTNVSLYPAIVTAKRSNGFYLQELDANIDSDVKTSEAVFVFTSSAPTVNVGDSVSAIGMVAEFRPVSGSLSNTEIDTTVTNAMITINSTGNSLPQPIVIGIGGRIPPTMTIESGVTLHNVETSGTFDPGTDAIDFYESLEAMLVQVNNAVAVGPTVSDEIPVLPDNGVWASVRSARGGILVRSNDFNPERIILDGLLVPSSLPNVNVGDTFTSRIVGVLDYTQGNFKLHVTSLPGRVDHGLALESTAPAGANQFAVATFNVNNLRATNAQSKFDTLAGLIVNNLRSPDLLSLEEIQDNDGTVDSGIVTATQTIANLINAITSAGGPTYAYRQIDPENNADGGVPGGNIRIVFLFRTDRGLTFVDRPCACNPATTATFPELGANGVQLHYSPGRVDPTNTAWSSPDPVRKPLAGEFLFGGQHLFVIGNHWKSKVSDDSLYGPWQPPTQWTLAQRKNEATVVKTFVASILALDPNAKVIVLGDLNDYEFSEPLTILKSGGLRALVEDLPANERYTYNFDGNAQAIDHILVSNALYNTTFPQLDIVHFNSEFATRASDHDSVIARFILRKTFIPFIVR